MPDLATDLDALDAALARLAARVAGRAAILPVAKPALHADVLAARDLVRRVRAHTDTVVGAVLDLVDAHGRVVERLAEIEEAGRKLR
jgi:hypothetical protein